MIKALVKIMIKRRYIRRFQRRIISWRRRAGESLSEESDGAYAKVGRIVEEEMYQSVVVSL